MELTRSATNSIKGVSILAIVLSHANITTIPSAAQIGVWLFLFTSGYGICKSYGLELFNAKEYLIKRFNRGVLPFWLALATYLLLFPQTRDMISIVSNFFLIVLYPHDIIGGGWFITYIFAWYLIYLFVSRIRASEHIKLLFLLIIIPTILVLGSGFFIFLIATFMPSTYSETLYTGHIFYAPYSIAFPIGVLAAKYGKVRISFSIPIMEYVGRISYPIYLFHFGFIWLIQRFI